jgi:hypothetical protein
MGKIGKTFTIDLDIYTWLEQHAKDKNRKVSFVVNKALRQIKRISEQWQCPVCNTYNDNRSLSCDVMTDGEFCEGKPPKS